MHVVRHHYGNMQSHFAAIVMEAVFQGYVARGRRQFPSEVCVKGDEVFPASALYVRQVSPVVIFANLHGGSEFTASFTCA